MSRKITGRFLGLDGNPVKGHIAFRPSVQLNDIDSTSMVLPDRVSVKLDKTGAFLVKLECTDDPKWTPQGWKIKVIEQIPNGRSYFMPTTAAPQQPPNLTAPVSTWKPTSEHPQYTLHGTRLAQ